MRATRGQGRQVEPLQPGVGDRAGLSAVGALDLGCIRDVVAHVQVGKESVVLEDQADRASLGGQERVGRGVVEGQFAEADCPAAQRIQPGERPQQCRLAGSVRSENTQDLAGRNAQIDREVEVTAVHSARYMQRVAARRSDSARRGDAAWRGDAVGRCFAPAHGAVPPADAAGLVPAHVAVPALSHRPRRPARTAIDTTSRTSERATAASGSLSRAR